MSLFTKDKYRENAELQHVCTLAARYTVTTCMYSRCKVYSYNMCVLSLQGVQLQDVFTLVARYTVTTCCVLTCCVVSLQGIDLHVCTLSARYTVTTCVYSSCKV